MDNDAIQAAIHDTLRQAAVDPAAGPLLIACSGGADSIALLHAAHSAAVPCIAAHFDHALRGADSSGDRDFVEAFAAALGIPCVTAAWENSDGLGSESLEMAARRARYAFLTGTARDHGCCAIATAHHRDDQAETVLMRLIRGASPHGLAAIPRFTRTHGVPILRPLLHVSRADIEAYLATHGLNHREDATNTDTAILRNRIRHELLPELERAYNPALRQALARFAHLQAAENDFVAGLTARAAESLLDSEGAVIRRRFAPAHVALQRRLLVDACARKGLYPPFERLEAARNHVLQGETGSRVDLGEGWCLINARGRSVLRHTTDADRAPLQVTPLPVPGTLTAMGRRFRTRYVNVDEAKVDACSPDRQVFDADRLGPSPAVRRRDEGDRFEPLGLHGTCKLKDFFIDRAVPVDDRDSIPLLLAGDRIVWVIGVGVGQFAAISPSTRRVVEVTVEPPS